MSPLLHFRDGCSKRSFSVLAPLVLWGCGGSAETVDSGTGGAGGEDTGTVPTEMICTEGEIGEVCVGPERESDEEDPSAQPMGGGGPIGGGGAASHQGCSISGKVRDFRRGDKGGHPDFEMYWGSGIPGLVEMTLSPSGLPILSDEHPTIGSPATFAQWYTDTDESITLSLSIKLVESNGLTEFGSESYFPIDGLGFGNEDFEHNYHFTTELHARFLYNAGSEAMFAFRGDDDLWVFINGKLAIDLGSVHGPASRTVKLDDVASELKIENGQEYTLDLFHAERRTAGSTFYVQTNLAFRHCQ